MSDSQSQKAGERAVQIQAGGNVNLGLSYADVRQMIVDEREHNLEFVLERAKQMMVDAQLPLDRVPVRILLPLTQYASLEDDVYLRERWAALLANASAETVGVHPSFPQLLSRLSSRDARFLEGVFDSVVKQFEVMPYRASPSTLKSARALDYTSLGLLFSELRLTPIPWAMTYGDVDDFGAEVVDDQKSQLECILANLIGLGLLATERTSAVDGRWFEQGLEPVLKHETTFRLTALGFELVLACKPPKKASA